MAAENESPTFSSRRRLGISTDLKDLIAISKKQMYSQSKAKHPLALIKKQLNSSMNESVDMSTTQIMIDVLKNKITNNLDNGEISMYSAQNESTNMF